jgi:hypothetical protein
MSRPLSSVIVAAFVLSALAGTAAGQASFWEVAGFGDLERGEFENVSLLPSGVLVLGPGLEDLGIPAADYAWSVAYGPNDDVYLTTGSPGRLVRVQGARAEVLYEDEVLDLPALAVAPDGRVFVGTAPGGSVLEVTPDGAADSFFETGQGSVWDMTWSDELGLIVATGDTAAVYAVDSDGSGRLLLTSSEAGFASVAALGERVLAGSVPGGMLFHVTPGSGVRVLYDTRFEEITGIVVEEDGAAFAASTVLFEDALADDSTFDSTFGEGAVMWCPWSGAAVELWQSPDAPVTALGRGPSGTLWAGTGTGGAIHELEGGRATLIARVESEEVMAIRPSENGVLIAAGLPAAAYVVPRDARPAGTYRSDVLDAGPGAAWGELSWRGETPRGAELALSTRSGNTGLPDDTWSEWTDIEGDRNGRVRSPGARFLQWRARLEAGAGNVSPRLFGVTVAFSGSNRPPVLQSVAVFEPVDAVAEGEGYGSNAARQSFPSGLEVTYNIDAGGGPRGFEPGPVPWLRTAEWIARDPDGDRLSFDLSVRSEDETTWKPMARDLTRSAHTWDSRTMQDGYYTVRVTASDAPDRVVGADVVSLESEPFLVDNGRPLLGGIDVEERDGRLSVSGTARDELSPVMAIHVSLDYGDWLPAPAMDGLVDSRLERFEVTLDHPGSGEHAVAVRVVDRQGNVVVESETVTLGRP